MKVEGKIWKLYCTCTLSYLYVPQNIHASPPKEEFWFETSPGLPPPPNQPPTPLEILVSVRTV